MNQSYENLIAIAEHNFNIRNFTLSETILNKALSLKPNDSKANELLGYIFANLDNPKLSHQHLLNACAQPDCSAKALYYLGSSYLDLSQFEIAIECFKRSVGVAGNFFEALHDLGTAYAMLGKNNDALHHYKLALNICITSPELFFNLGRLYDELTRYDEALVHYDKAISLNPTYAEAWSYKGITLIELQLPQEALRHQDWAIKLNPSLAAAYYNKGAILNDLRLYSDAIDCYQAALALKPSLNFLIGHLIHAKSMIADWDNLESTIRLACNRLKNNQKVIAPFNLLPIIDSPELHLKASKIWISHKYPINPSLGPILKGPREKIRIGYYSPDFTEHPVAQLICELFELHNKKQFELFGFCLKTPTRISPIRSRLISSFDHFLEMGSISEINIAKQSRELGIDIAINLGGHTQSAKTGIFSYRAAPIQVNYLGYPGTMGADYMDYIIADKILIPSDSEQFFSEKIVYLPNSYQANDSKKIISDKTFSRKDLGILKSSFVFCCFNNTYKISPASFDSWMRILKQVPNSVLLLLEDNDLTRINLIKEAKNRGVLASQLIFVSRVPPDQHLARLKVADLFLDTLPYNAHTTCSDALWSGLPVLTLEGHSFSGRVASSLLSAISLPELITKSQDEYESLAIHLATNPIHLRAIKQKVLTNRLLMPLFNSSIFTKHIEQAYQSMYSRYIDGLATEHIYINP